MWGTKAYSVYTNATDSIDTASARAAVNSVLSFLNRTEIIDYTCHQGYISRFIEGKTLVTVKSDVAVVFIRCADVNSNVKKEIPLPR